MKITDLCIDWICNTELFEMAFSRKDAINKVRALQQQIAKHIVKYLHYDASDETKKHWDAEINGWLLYIDELELKNRKKLTGDVYYDLLFKEPLETTSSLNRIIKNIDKIPGMKDHNKIGSVPELHIKCEKILHAISYDLANDKFEDFLYYVNKV